MGLEKTAKERIFLLANNTVGLEICKYLRERETLVGLAVQIPEKQICTEEIIRESGLKDQFIFEAPMLREEKYLDQIRRLSPTLSISSFWGHIMKKDFLDIAEKGNINFHPGYLPYNRGMNPNVWPFIENTPAGVTIHYMDEGIDTGDIIARKKVKIGPTDTGGSLYEKTLTEIVKLFKDNWERIKSGEIETIPQEGLDFTFHYLRDVNQLDKIDLDRKYTGRELINLLRSRTYGDRSFAHYFENGVKVNIGVFLEED